ncbi:Membrane transport protein [compost metagenome]
MLALLPVFAYIFGFAVLGAVLKGVGVLTPPRVQRLNWTALNVTLPALIIVSVHRSPPLDARLLWIPLASWLTLLAGCLLGYVVLLKLMKLPPCEAGSLFLPALMGNTTFVGYPAVSALLGDAGLLRAIFYDQLANGIFFATAGVAIAQWASAGSRIAPSILVKRVLTFPPLWGLLIGFLAKGMAIPEPLFTVLDWLGSVTVPFFLLGLGASLSLAGWRQTLPGALAVSAAKLVILPMIAYGIHRALHLPPIDFQVSTLQAAMPSALFSVSLAIVYKLNTPLVVNSVALCLLLSAVTLPFWAWLLGLG